LYKHEVTAYEKLEDQKCPFIPRFYGCYVTDFPDRDLVEDQCVNVVVLEYIRGVNLSQGVSNAANKSIAELEKLVEDVYSSLDGIHKHSVTHGFALPRKCIIKKNGKAVWTDFTNSHFPDSKKNSEESQGNENADLTHVTELFARTFEELGVPFFNTGIFLLHQMTHR
jgi:RIO-like serine/threonine protein kinase